MNALNILFGKNPKFSSNPQSMKIQKLNKPWFFFSFGLVVCGGWGELEVEKDLYCSNFSKILSGACQILQNSIFLKDLIREQYHF